MKNHGNHIKLYASRRAKAVGNSHTILQRFMHSVKSKIDYYHALKFLMRLPCMKKRHTLFIILLILTCFILAGCLKKPSDPAPKRPATGETVILYAVGDIMVGHAATPFLEKHGYTYPFRKIKHIFKDADLTLGNLEVPITDHPIPLSKDKTYTYKANKQSLQAIKITGFDLMCLANNHILDYDVTGLKDTLTNLDNTGIKYFGAGENHDESVKGTIVTVKGIRIGFLAFMQPFYSYVHTYKFFAEKNKPGVARLGAGVLKRRIKALKQDCDIVIVSLHWGTNYKGVSSFQKKWGKKAAAYGADLVIGHHPHIIQGVEVYKNTPVLFSLGNFTFGTRGRFHKVDELLHYGWIARITIQGDAVTKIALIPVETNNKKVYYQPQVGDRSQLPAINALINKNFKAQPVIENNALVYTF